ncbi:DUF4376 domain-containing protein, partial [Salmonella enterica subsp. enterica]|nr:DUF4376 domain-containing protein [Salmonella enterica subsp. enterica]
MTTITDARNGRYNENGSVSAEVLFSDSAQYLPYTATPHDQTDYGRQLFADLVSGKYGGVKPFTVTPDMLSAAKDAKHAEINAWRDAQENGNYIFQYDGRNWDYGKSTQERMSISLVMAKRNALPEGFAWTDGDNNIVPMDNAGLIALAAAIEQAMFEMGMKINLRQLQMKADIASLTDLSAVRQYVVGWPAGADK